MNSVKQRNVQLCFQYYYFKQLQNVKQGAQSPSSGKDPGKLKLRETKAQVYHKQFPPFTRSTMQTAIKNLNVDNFIYHNITVRQKV